MKLRRSLTFAFLLLTVLLCRGAEGIAAEAAERAFSFGVIADVQYGDFDPSGGKHYRTSHKKLEEAVQEFNRHGLGFVIQLGDLIEERWESFDMVLPIFEKSKAKKYHVLGNHDYSVKGDMKYRVPERLGMDRNYYDFEQGNMRFIVVDGNEISLYSVPMGSEKYSMARNLWMNMMEKGLIQAIAYNGGMSDEQFRWLKSKLDESRESGQKVVVFSHFPAYPPHRENLWNNEDLMTILESCDCVVAHLNGHAHRNIYAEKNGIHYLTLTGMVNTADENAFAIVTVYEDRLEVKGYGRVPDRVLKFNP